MEMPFPVAPPARRCAPASGRCHYCLRPEGSIHILVYQTYRYGKVWSMYRRQWEPAIKKGREVLALFLSSQPAYL